MAKTLGHPQRRASRRCPSAILICVSDQTDDRLGDAVAETGADTPPPLLGAIVAVAGTALLTLLILLITPLREGLADAISGDAAGLRHDLRGLGISGVLIVLTLGIVHAVVWFPAEILDLAVGFIYDFWVALPLVMAVWMINAGVAYSIGRHAARPLLYRFIAKQRFDRLEQIAQRGGATLLLAMRLIPVIPFSMFSIVAGAAHVPFGRFAWTTFVGYLPITIVFVYLGSQLEELSPTDPILWVGAAVLIGLLFLTHRFGRMLSEHRAAAKRDPASP